MAPRSLRACPAAFLACAERSRMEACAACLHRQCGPLGLTSAFVARPWAVLGLSPHGRVLCLRGPLGLKRRWSRIATVALSHRALWPAPCRGCSNRLNSNVRPLMLNGAPLPSRSPTVLRRALLLGACVVAGSFVGLVGKHFFGSSAGFLAVPALLAVAWLVVANPTECLPPAERSPHNDSAPQ